MNMNMDMSTTGTASGPSATSSSSMNMDMGMDTSAQTCKINMLWNWYTIDTCFLSSSWHITSTGMFAGTCIAVICLVLTLEFLRRTGKEYDRFLLRHAQRRRHLAADPSSVSSRCLTSDVRERGDDAGKSAASDQVASSQEACGGAQEVRFRPSVVQQAIRALLHMLQFAVAYFVMLLAMYYNGYLIICIFIGTFLGFFVFGWESVSLSGPQEEVTVCCG